MTKKAIADAFERPAPRRGDGAARGRRALALRGRLAGRHERDPRGHHPAARGVRQRRLAGTRPDADARARGAARGGDPRVQARAVLAGRSRLRRRRRAPLRGPLPRRQADRRGARRPGRGGVPRPARRDHEAREEGGARALAAPLRPHLAPAGGQHEVRLLRQAHAGRGPEALRAAQGDHVPAHELALALERHDPRDPSHGRAGREEPRIRKGGGVRHRR